MAMTCSWTNGLHDASHSMQHFEYFSLLLLLLIRNNEVMAKYSNNGGVCDSWDGLRDSVGSSKLESG